MFIHPPRPSQLLSMALAMMATCLTVFPFNVYMDVVHALPLAGIWTRFCWFFVALLVVGFGARCKGAERVAVGGELPVLLQL
jgi:uncharacterized membrane protein